MNKTLLVDELGTIGYFPQALGQSELSEEQMKSRMDSINWMQTGRRWRYMNNLTSAEKCCNIQRLVPVFEDAGVRKNGDSNFYTILTPRDSNGLYTVPTRHDIPAKFRGVKTSTPFLIWTSDIAS